MWHGSLYLDYLFRYDLCPTPCPFLARQRRRHILLSGDYLSAHVYAGASSCACQNQRERSSRWCPRCHWGHQEESGKCRDGRGLRTVRNEADRLLGHLSHAMYICISDLMYLFISPQSFHFVQQKTLLRCPLASCAGPLILH